MGESNVDEDVIGPPFTEPESPGPLSSDSSSLPVSNSLEKDSSLLLSSSSVSSAAKSISSPVSCSPKLMFLTTPLTRAWVASSSASA